MHALTIDHLSGGRMILGLGVSGPQVVEGWYGMPFARPLARTREYVSILRQIWKRAEPVSNDGRTIRCRTRAKRGARQAAQAITHPLRPDIPIFLGAEGPKNVALATRDLRRLVAALLLAVPHPEVYAESLAQARPGFEIALPVIVTSPTTSRSV